jgi:hypothetical protein
VYICTLQDFHPLVKRLKDGGRICVIARSMYQGWRITVIQQSIRIAYNKPDQGVSEASRDLYLKDGVSSKFQSERFPHVLSQAFIKPDALSKDLPTPNIALIL